MKIVHVPMLVFFGMYSVMTAIVCGPIILLICVCMKLLLDGMGNPFKFALGMITMPLAMPAELAEWHAFTRWHDRMLNP